MSRLEVDIDEAKLRLHRQVNQLVDGLYTPVIQQYCQVANGSTLEQEDDIEVVVVKGAIWNKIQKAETQVAEEINHFEDFMNFVLHNSSKFVFIFFVFTKALF